MRQTIIGFFNNASEAERAVERLRSEGFSESDIDISTRHMESSNTESTSSDDYSSGRRSQDTPYSVSDESRYRESGTENLHQDTLNEDRIRERRDQDDDDSIGDSIGRFFRNLFDNKEEVERYSSVGRKSSIVSVYAESSDQAERARDILDDSGAVDVEERAREVGTNTYARGMDTTSSPGSVSDDERRNALGVEGTSDRSIPVIEENVNIGKEEVQRGGVRLRSRIVERPVEENLRLREERVKVERIPADRPATEGDFDTFREGEIEITETAEVPIVKKEARVVEEIRLTKDVEERDEVVRDSVRKTDVDIENLSEDSVKSKRPRKK